MMITCHSFGTDNESITVKNPTRNSFHKLWCVIVFICLLVV